MTDASIRNKQSLIQQLRDVAEKETAWLEKNRLLYAQKREQLDHLTKERGLTGGEVTPEEQKLISDVIKIGQIRTPDNLVRSGRGPSSFAVTALMRSPLIARFPVVGEYIKDVADSYAARRRDTRLLDPISGLEPAVQRAASRQQGQATP